METVVEFTIGGTSCCVVSEGEVAAERLDGISVDGEGPDGLHVVGNCCVLGRRYLILSDAPAVDPDGDPLPCIKDLLTPRELQVALLVAGGHVNKQIADRLRISEFTVASYLRRVFVKFGVRTRAAMVARMMAERHV
jgi:DNA-binding CsgD family transcriptional regulator